MSPGLKEEGGGVERKNRERGRRKEITKRQFTLLPATRIRETYIKKLNL